MGRLEGGGGMHRRSGSAQREAGEKACPAQRAPSSWCGFQPTSRLFLLVTPRAIRLQVRPPLHPLVLTMILGRGHRWGWVGGLTIGAEGCSHGMKGKTLRNL